MSRTRDGETILRHAVDTLGSRLLDPESPVGRALAAWRRELIEDLGGPETISTQQAALVDVAVRSKLLLDSIDTWLLNRRSIVDRKTRDVFPAARSRNAFANTLRNVLKDLGMSRRKRELPTLSEYMKQRAEASPQDDATGGAGGTVHPKES
jgi:hypothetical protein